MGPTPEVGWWYYICCERDLYQIESGEELAVLLAEQVEEWEELGWPWYKFHATRDAAMAEIGPTGWIANDP